MKVQNLKHRLAGALLGASVIALSACGGSKPDPIKPDEARMHLTVDGPPGGTGRGMELRARNVVSGREVKACFELAVPGDTNTVTMDVPAGDIEISGKVTAQFDSGICSGSTNWFAEPVAIRLIPGEERAVTLHFLSRAGVIVEPTWEEQIRGMGGAGAGGGGAGGSGGAGGGPPLACGADWGRVPREAMAVNAAGPLGTGLRAVYSDGDVRFEGPLDFGPYEPGFVPSYYPADQLADESAPALWETIWGIGSEDLSGFIVAPRTGQLEFLILCDDYCSLEFGNGLLSLLADNTGAASGAAQVQAGTAYAASLRYENRWGSNGYKVYWRCAPAA